MVISRIYEGVCSHHAFAHVVGNYRRLAYILTEPMRDKHLKKSLLGAGWHKMRAIMLAEPGINNKTGLTDTKLMDTQVKLFQFFYQYEHGTPIQRIQQENKNTNLNVEVDGNKVIELANTEDELRAVLEAVKGRLSQLPLPPQPQIEPRLVLPTEISHRDAGRREKELDEKK